MSQDFSKDMNKVYETYKSNSGIGFTIKYVLHENHNETSRIISSKNGLYVKLKNKVLSRYDYLTTVTSPNKIITIDNSNKSILIKNFNKNIYTDVPDFIGQFKNYEKSVVKTKVINSNVPNIIIYSVELKTGGLAPISKYEISIDKKSGYITKMSLFYTTKLDKDEDYGIKGTEIPRLDIFFSDFNDKKIVNANEFDDFYYYTKVKGGVIPSVNYKNYTVKEKN